MSIEKIKLTDHSKRKMSQRGVLEAHFQIRVMLVHFYSEELREKPSHYTGNSRIIAVVLSRLWRLYDKNIASVSEEQMFLIHLDNYVPKEQFTKGNE